MNRFLVLTLSMIFCRTTFAAELYTEEVDRAISGFIYWMISFAVSISIGVIVLRLLDKKQPLDAVPKIVIWLAILSGGQLFFFQTFDYMWRTFLN